MQSLLIDKTTGLIHLHMMLFFCDYYASAGTEHMPHIMQVLQTGHEC